MIIIGLLYGFTLQPGFVFDSSIGNFDKLVNILNKKLK